MSVWHEADDLWEMIYGTDHLMTPELREDMDRCAGRFNIPQSIKPTQPYFLGENSDWEVWAFPKGHQLNIEPREGTATPVVNADGSAV